MCFLVKRIGTPYFQKETRIGTLINVRYIVHLIKRKDSSSGTELLIK